MPNPYQQGLWQLAPVRNPGAVAFMVSDPFSALLDQEAGAEAGPRAGDATARVLPCRNGSSPGDTGRPGTLGEDAQLQGLSAFASQHLEGLGRCQRWVVVQDLPREEMENHRSGETKADF